MRKGKQLMMKTTLLILAGAALAMAVARAEDKSEKKDEPSWTKTMTGLQYKDIQVGTGAAPKTGQTCVMHYTGWLWENGQMGKKFQSSVDSGQPLKFQLGVGMVIKGWDEGVATMKVGGKRKLLIPPQLGYGARGREGVIPPNATLLFELELLGIE
jgi:peptidylprolyl isomerase